MNRKRFVGLLTAFGGTLAAGSDINGFHFTRGKTIHPTEILSSDLVICGGGLGGCAASLAALRNNLKVTLTEETDWIGGQVTGKLLDLHYSNPSTLAIKELGFNPTGADTSPLFNLWTYRRIINKTNFKPGVFKSDITVVNWPQNDFLNGNLIDANPAETKNILDNARQLSLSLLYWLQTEAPHGDKGYGWPGLRLRKDIMGTEDGLAKHPYIRESRRIKALFTILEEHVGKENRLLVAGKEANSAAVFNDSIGIGYYHIDLHPTCGGDNYIDFDSLPFQIPLGALLPERLENLIAANKNIGTTHITNGCYRLHPVEWSIGEAAGCIASFALKKKVIPKAVHENESLLVEFQNLIGSQGITTRWPDSM